MTTVNGISSPNKAMAANQTQVERSLARLGSGKRINRAADDAAISAMVSALEAEGASNAQAQRNVSDAVSLSNIADGAMEQQGELLGRMRELSVQSSNGTLSSSDRQAIQQEVSSLSAELDRISATTEFNGQPLLSGASYDVQAGTGSGTSDQIAMSTANTAGASLGVAGVDVTTQGGAQSAISSIDTAISRLSSGRATMGATANRLQAARSNLATSFENHQASLSRMRDTDIAQESSNLQSARVRQVGSVSAALQARDANASLLRLIG